MHGIPFLTPYSFFNAVPSFPSFYNFTLLTEKNNLTLQIYHDIEKIQTQINLDNIGVNANYVYYSEKLNTTKLIREGREKKVVSNLRQSCFEK